MRFFKPNQSFCRWRGYEFVGRFAILVNAVLINIRFEPVFETVFETVLEKVNSR